VSPIAWTIQVCLFPAAIGFALLVKWWTIWFVLGQNFSRTTGLLLSSLAASLLSGWLLLSSGAIGSVDPTQAEPDLGSSAWYFAWLASLLASFAIESAWLQVCMRRLVRPDWTWRHYDRLGFAIAHFVALAAAVLHGLWRAGAFRVS
jgi:hypothetical protein